MVKRMIDWLIPEVHTIEIDGKSIEISHDSFLKLKESLIS